MQEALVFISGFQIKIISTRILKTARSFLMCTFGATGIYVFLSLLNIKPSTTGLSVLWAQTTNINCTLASIFVQNDTYQCFVKFYNSTVHYQKCSIYQKLYYLNYLKNNLLVSHSNVVH